MIDIVKNLNEINKLEQEIYQSFSYEGDWRVYPIDNKSNYIWFSDKYNVYWLSSEEELIETISNLDDKDFVHSLNEEDLINYFIDNEIFCYSNVIVKNLGVSKCGKYTAFISDTQCDGNVFFSIFNNNKHYIKIISKPMTDTEHSKLVYLLDAIKLVIKSKTSIEKIQSLIDVVNYNGSNKFNSYINQIKSASMEDIEEVINTIREDVR